METVRRFSRQVLTVISLEISHTCLTLVYTCTNNCVPFVLWCFHMLSALGLHRSSCLTVWPEEGITGMNDKDEWQRDPCNVIMMIHAHIIFIIKQSKKYVHHVAVCFVLQLRGSELLHLLLSDHAGVAKPTSIRLDSNRLQRLLFHSLPIRLLVIHLQPFDGASNNSTNICGWKNWEVFLNVSVHLCVFLKNLYKLKSF